MKINDVKHNHSLTDLLKVLIFSILMITPLLSVATRCLYVICNKNAYQSYTENTYKTIQPIYYESNEVNNANDIIVDRIYYYSNNISSITYTNFTVIGINQDLYLQQFPDYNEGNITAIDIYFSANGVAVRITRSDIENSYINISSTPMYFIPISNGNREYYPQEFIDKVSETDFKYVKEYVEVTQEGTLDNVFEYSVNKLEESPIINWTSNTAIYTGVNTMTTQLGITQSVIPMLITYWFLLTIIYVILDIVLKLFTILTHIIGGKKSN